MGDGVMDRRDWLKVGIGALAGAAMPSLWPHLDQAEPHQPRPADQGGDRTPPGSPPASAPPPTASGAAGEKEESS